MMCNLFVTVFNPVSNISRHCACNECLLQVSWPASIVISSQCMDVYNEAFRFLLQIKRVKYSLDGLKFLGNFNIHLLVTIMVCFCLASVTSIIAMTYHGVSLL